MAFLLSIFDKTIWKPISKIEELSSDAIYAIWNTSFMQQMNNKLNLKQISKAEWLQFFNEKQKEIYSPSFFKKV